MKTVEQWMETIAGKKIRGQAMRNLNAASAACERVSLYAAVEAAFAWESTPEGFDYWIDIADKILAGKLKTREI